MDQQTRDEIRAAMRGGVPDERKTLVARLEELEAENERLRTHNSSLCAENIGLFRGLEYALEFVREIRKVYRTEAIDEIEAQLCLAFGERRDPMHGFRPALSEYRD